MSGYEWDFRAAFLHPELWFKALSVTLGYAVATTALGLLLGVICGMLLLSRYWIFRAPVSAFVQVFRCTPLLIQIIWFYTHCRSPSISRFPPGLPPAWG